MHKMAHGADLRWVGLWLGLALIVVTACSGGGGSSSGGSGGSGDSTGGGTTGGTSLTLQALGGGTATLADGTYETACRTCETSSTCSDKDRILVSGTTVTFTTFQYSDLACTAASGTDGPNTATATVGSTQAAGCFTYTPTAGTGSQPVPTCAAAGISGNPLASQVTLALSVGGTFKTLALIDPSGPKVFFTDDRGAGGPCDPLFCTDLSTFPWVKQP